MTSDSFKPNLIGLLGAVLLALSFSLQAQNYQLQGKIINSKTGQPISQARIEIAQGDKAFSDDYGAYILNLGVANKYQPGEELIVHIQHKVHGYFLERFVVPSSLNHNFSISPNTMKSFTGTIRDVDTGDPLKGMRVSFFSQQFADPTYTPPTIFSNESGFFRFIIDRKQVGEIDYAKLSVIDDKSCYESFGSIVSISGDHEILLKDKCKPSLEGGGDYKREKIPGCEEKKIGTICLKNIGHLKTRVLYGQPQPGQNYVAEFAMSGLWMDPGEEKCIEGLEAGRYLIKIDRGLNGHELYMRGVEKNYWKILGTCETIYVGCKLATSR